MNLSSWNPIRYGCEAAQMKVSKDIRQDYRGWMEEFQEYQREI